MAVPAALLFVQGASALYGADQILKSGEIEERALNYQAQNEEINAQFRSIERRERLLDAMAANNAALGVRGVTSEGSPMTILEADYKNASQEEAIDLMDSRNAVVSLRAKAKAARKLSKINAFQSLLGTGVDMAKTGAKPNG